MGYISHHFLTGLAHWVNAGAPHLVKLCLNPAQSGHSSINLEFSVQVVGDSNPKHKATVPFTIK